jgi:alcohol dehydrogenase class IV
MESGIIRVAWFIGLEQKEFVIMGIFHFPVKIISADGCLSGLSDEVDRLGARRPLIVTDPGIVAAGILDKITGPLEEKGVPYSVFDGVEPDPKIRNIVEAAEVIKKGNHDLLIGLGGGSSIDAAKAAAILSVNEVDLREFQGPREEYPQRPLPLITIPTTAGTGSEVSSASVIVDEEKQYKMYFKSPQIFAKVVFLDASILVGIPSPLAAATGIDTLTHALEAYLNPNRTAASEAMSLGSIGLVFSNLRPFVANTHRQENAQNMLNASWLAGVSMTTAGLGLVHALAHPLGVKGKIHHGLACALVLPHVLRFNWLADSDRYLPLALAMDWTIRAEYPKHTDVGQMVIQEVEELLSDIGIPKRLSDIQTSLDDVNAVVDEAYNSFLNQVNPRQATKEDLDRIMDQII